MSRRRSIIFAAITTVITCLLLEGMLHVVTLLSKDFGRAISARQPVIRPSLPDSVMGHRPNPDFPSHDRNGFRNREIPDPVDVICIGDSQTYGTGVSTDEAWPAALERESGLTTYSMAFGGYGPSHALVLLESAIAMRPTSIVYGFYLGNDLLDAFHDVHTSGRRQQLGTEVADTLNVLHQLEKTDPVRAKSRLYFSQLGATKTVHPPTSSQPIPFRHKVKLYLVYRTAKKRIEAKLRAPKPKDRDAAWAEMVTLAADSSRFCEVHEMDGVRTLFTPEYRGAVLDVRDPRVREGFRISMASITRMNERCAAAGIRFLVVIIPTKEYVFAPFATGASTAYGRLTAHEAAVFDDVEQAFGESGVMGIAATPVLRGVIEAGKNPYPESWDGHPNAAGHRAIAAMVGRYLEQR